MNNYKIVNLCNVSILFLGNTYTVYTLPEPRYDRLAVHSSRNYFGFRVKTCMDAHVALMPLLEPQLEQYYEIVIGGYSNTFSDIRKVGAEPSVVVHVPTTSVCSCDSFR